MSRPRRTRRTRGLAPRCGCLLLVLVATAAGCASGPRPAGTPGEPPAWTCDPEADRALTRGDTEAGIRLHEAFLADHPDNPLALYHLGYALGRTGDHRREIACYERAGDLGYEDGGLLFNLGMAYGETGRHGKAAEVLERAVKLDPDKADYRVGLGLALERSGRLDAAAEAFREAIRLDPRLTDARWFLALTHLEAGRSEAARGQLQGLLRIDPDHRRARDLLRRLEAGD